MTSAQRYKSHANMTEAAGVMLAILTTFVIVFPACRKRFFIDEEKILFSQRSCLCRCFTSIPNDTRRRFLIMLKISFFVFKMTILVKAGMQKDHVFTILFAVASTSSLIAIGIVTFRRNTQRVSKLIQVSECVESTLSIDSGHFPRICRLLATEFLRRLLSANTKL